MSIQIVSGARFFQMDKKSQRKKRIEHLAVRYHARLSPYFARGVNASLFVDQLISKLSLLDPTKKGKHLDWIVRRYLDGQIDVNGENDEITRFLALVSENPSAKGIDVNRIGTVDEFLSRASKLPAKIEISRRDRKKHEKQALLTNRDIDELHRDKQIIIYRVNTSAGAMYLAKGTQWCTADQDTAKSYLDSGCMHVVIIDGKKYQLHMALYRFSDENNKPLPIRNTLKRIFPLWGSLSTDVFRYSFFPLLPDDFLSDEGFRSLNYWECRIRTAQYRLGLDEIIRTFKSSDFPRDLTRNVFFRDIYLLCWGAEANQALLDRECNELDGILSEYERYEGWHEERMRVSQNGRDIRYVDEDLIDLEMCRVAIENDVGSMMFIPAKYIDRSMCEFSIRCSTEAILFIPTEFIDIDLYRFASAISEGVCDAFVDRMMDKGDLVSAFYCDPSVINTIKEANFTYELAMSVVSFSGELIKRVPNSLVDYKLCVSAVKSNALIIRDIPEEHLDDSLLNIASKKLRLKARLRRGYKF